MTPEQKARVGIDALLQQAGWHVCNVSDANIHAATGVAIREFPLNTGFGFADYLLYVNGKACGVIEAKKEGATLTGVELQSSRYAKGLPTTLPAWSRPLGQANVNGTKLQALSVPLPPLDEQTRIVTEVDRHLSIIREVKAEVDANLQRAQALRQATLAKAFSGE